MVTKFLLSKQFWLDTADVDYF